MRGLFFARLKTVEYRLKIKSRIAVQQRLSGSSSKVLQPASWVCFTVLQSSRHLTDARPHHH